MLNVSEEQIMSCIRLSADYHIQYLKAHSPNYDDMKLDVLGMLYDIDLTNLTFKKILALPLGLILITLFLLIFCVLAPFQKLIDSVDRYKAIKKHRKDKSLDAGDYDGTLDVLWYHYGIDKDHPREERQEVLEQWIKILYPKSTVNSINIIERLVDIHQRNVETRKQMDATCVLFCDELDSVISEIGNDFPLYANKAIETN